MATALITGASAGLGRELAVQLSRAGHDLVLVARDRRRLGDLAEQLRTEHRVQVEVLPADLADRDAVERVAERVRSSEPSPVSLLVNNAGYGLGERFTRSDLAQEEAALAVMVRAVLVLTRAATDAMLPRRRGAILNVASVAGLMASGTYSAHKAWVRTFTEGLARTLHGTGVTATVVNPGLTRTEFHERAGWGAGEFPDLAWLSAERVVADALAAVRRGAVEVTPSVRYRIGSAILRHAPRPLVRAISRSF